MCTALREAQKNGLVIVAHSEDRSMTDGRAVNEGKIAALLGIPGRPAVAEEYMIQRDAMLAGYTGGTVHIAHISTAGSVEILRQSKAAGVDISCETCPQYFTLTEEEVLKKGTLAKVFPPLRTQKDVDQILAGLQDGTIDIIATDHAPHAAYEKAQSLPDAPGGRVGLETALAAARCVCVCVCVLVSALRRSRAWGGGTVDPKLFHSKSVNTPFAGMTLRGKVAYTICGGKVVFRAGQD
jgi:dihydroorotase